MPNPPRVASTAIVLTRKAETGPGGMIGYAELDYAAERVVRALAITTEDAADLGDPEKVTVTIRPGDLLNAPTADIRDRERVTAEATRLVEDAGGRVLDASTALMVAWVDADGQGHTITKATLPDSDEPDYRWLAYSLGSIARQATAKGDRLGQPLIDYAAEQAAHEAAQVAPALRVVDGAGGELDGSRTSVIEPCPECTAGKCGNCDGRAWDAAQDTPTACPCATAGHPRRTS